MTKKVKNIIKISGAFCAAFVAAGTITYITKYPGDGKGGLGTSAVPQYDTAAVTVLEDGSKSETEKAVEQIALETESVKATTDAQDVATLEKAETNPFDGELYYYSYRIKKGDMIGVIAEKYNVSQDTLISVNKIRATRAIQIGQNIKIPSLDGILYDVKQNGETAKSIAQKFQVEPSVVADANKIDVALKLDAGRSVFVPGAELDWVTRQEINGDLFRKPIHTWYRLTSYFGWRPSPFGGRRQFHGGIDMACPSGTPIYAAMGGTITYKGYSNVYGNYVIVTHHSGYKTLYGHMSRFSKLGVGAYVNTQSVIGYVGSTGMSTGPHCHFTVFKNGRMVNPWNLWG